MDHITSVRLGDSNLSDPHSRPERPVRDNDTPEFMLEIALKPPNNFFKQLSFFGS